jgi:hypothetical protein
MKDEKDFKSIRDLIKIEDLLIEIMYRYENEESEILNICSRLKANFETERDLASKIYFTKK